MAEPPEIAVRIGERLRERGETIATTESATGGLVGGLITAVPGSSAYFDRGFVTYAYRAKRGTLGIDRELLDEHGAVSEPVAAAMARRARDLADTTWGVSVTGIAGPAGGTDEKPVGTTYIGVAYAGEWGSHESTATVTEYRFDGDRQTVRERAATQALRDIDAHLDSRQ